MAEQELNILEVDLIKVKAIFEQPITPASKITIGFVKASTDKHEKNEEYYKIKDFVEIAQTNLYEAITSYLLSTLYEGASKDEE